MKSLITLLMGSTFLVLSCGDLKECGYMDETKTWIHAEGTKIESDVTFLGKITEDTAQTDSIRFKLLTDSTATLKIKRYCQYITLQKDPLSANAWILNGYDSNWGWSGMNCDVLPFEKPQVVTVKIQDSSLSVRWTGDPCEEIPSNNNNTNDDDDSFDWD